MRRIYYNEVRAHVALGKDAPVTVPAAIATGIQLSLRCGRIAWPRVFTPECERRTPLVTTPLQT
jgi:hypothetical protein